MTPVTILYTTSETERCGTYLRVSQTQYGVRILVIDEDGEKGLYLTDAELAALTTALVGSVSVVEGEASTVALLPADPLASPATTETLLKAARVRDGWRGLAAWMRAAGTIDPQDSIDSCARAVEHYAEYQFKLATEPIPDVEGTEPRLNRENN